MENIMFQQLIPVLENYGILGLVILAFAESSFFPVFPDFLLIPMCLSNPDQALLYALIATVASAAGACFGYTLGKYIGSPLLHYFTSSVTTEKIERAFKAYGTWAVLLAGLTPLPYKLFTISSGIFALPLPRFFVATLIGRGIRFLLEAILIMIVGEKAVGFIRNNFPLLSIILAVIILAILLIVKMRNKKAGETIQP
ncbi:MAG: DedA family protein [Syntrophomonadaceae bacterium]|nr:DedA family protein [Syntrophomonadaceae bacterium]